MISSRTAQLAGVCLSWTVGAGTGFDGAGVAGGRLNPTTAAGFAQEKVAAVVSRHAIPGAVLVVVQGGRVIFQQGYGMADLTSERPVRADRTLFRVASVSKLLTAAAAVQLAQAGRLALDDNVNEYLERIQIEPAFDRPVTLHHLLTHTSGFDVSMLHTAARFPEQQLGLAEYLEDYQPKRIRPPGVLDSYDNYGFALAGYLVQKTTSTPFAAYIERTLLEPLGMRSSSFQPGSALRERLARGYWRDGACFQSYPPDRVNISPAAGLCATGQDMARLMVALLGGTPPGGRTGLAKPVRQALLTPQFSVNGLVPGRCYGFNQLLLSGRRVLRQTGRWPGYCSVVLLSPQRDTGLFLAYNLADRLSFARKICRSFVERFIPRPLTTNTSVNRRAPDNAEIESLAGIFLSTRYPQQGPGLGRPKEIRVDTDGTNLMIDGQTFRCLEPGVYGRSGGAADEATGIRGERLTFWSAAAGPPSHVVTDRGSYRRAVWWETRAGRETGLLGILILLLAGTFWWPLTWSVRCLSTLCRKEEAPILLDNSPAAWLPVAAKGLAVLSCGFAVWYLAALAGASSGLEPLAYLYGLPAELQTLLGLAPLLVLLSLGLVTCATWAWWFGVWRLGERILYSLVAISLVLLCLGLHQRNLLFSRGTPQRSSLQNPVVQVDAEPALRPIESPGSAG